MMSETCERERKKERSEWKDWVPRCILIAWCSWLVASFNFWSRWESLSLFFFLKFLWLKKKTGLLPFKFANGMAFKPNYKTQSLECIKKGKTSQSKVSLSWNVLHITAKLLEKERESETCPNPISLVQAGKTCHGRCNCIFSLKWLDLTTLQWDVLPFGFSSLLMLVVLYPPSCILTSQQAMEHPPLRRDNVCAPFCFLHKQNARGHDREKDHFFTLPAISHP